MTFYAYLGFTSDSQLTFCSGTCDVSTLVGMTKHYVSSILMLGFKRSQGNINFE